MWIAVEGNIGVGKSTLVHDLASKMNWIAEGENVESNKTFQKHLSLFNTNYTHAINLQRWLSSKRIRDARRRTKQGGNHIVERSLLGDLVFTMVMYSRGYINTENYKHYLTRITKIFSKLEPPTYVIYLKATPEKCYSRLTQRSRTQESNIEESYIEDLSHQYNHTLPMYSVYWEIPLIVINFDEFKTGEQVKTLIEKHGEYK